MTQTTLLSATGLRKTYFTTEPPTEVLQGIDIEVAAGEFVAIMGASGSGKSTLLYCLSGMDRPTAGEVAIGGRAITDLDDEAMAKVRLTQLGFVFQQPHFLKNLTLRDNILLPALKAHPDDRAATLARVDALLERFEIAHVAEHGVSEVSGGQLQRAAICRALATQPTIVFADEPTGALNRAMSDEVMDALSGLHADGTTLVMVTHDAKAASRADRVVYLTDGLIAGAYELGVWTQPSAASREDALAGWLRGLGF